MARVDKTPEERFQPLQVEQIITCDEDDGGCGTDFDWVFTAPDGATDIEELDAEFAEDVTCPNCGRKWHQQYEGWTAHTDAG